DPPRLNDASPATGAFHPPCKTPIPIRLSQAHPIDRANDMSVTLSGPQGPEPVRGVPPEGGRLAFVTPTSPLASGARYSLVLNGPEDLNGYLLPFTRVEFDTTAPAASSAATPAGVRSDDSTGHAHHAARAAMA